MDGWVERSLGAVRACVGYLVVSKKDAVTR